MTNIEAKREHKSQRLERHLRTGNTVSARICEQLFGISGTGFHRQLNRFRTKGMIIHDRYVEHAGDRYKTYWIDDSQNARMLTKSRKYVAPKEEIS